MLLDIGLFGQIDRSRPGLEFPAEGILQRDDVITRLFQPDLDIWVFFVEDLPFQTPLQIAALEELLHIEGVSHRRVAQHESGGGDGHIAADDRQIVDRQRQVFRIPEGDGLEEHALVAVLGCDPDKAPFLKDPAGILSLARNVAFG